MAKTGRTTLTLLTILATCIGCQNASTRNVSDPIAAAARPILTLDPDAVWTDCYLALAADPHAALRYLAEHPRLRRTVAPDDLAVLVHCSLLRLLAHPASRPELSANCLEVTLNVLHFDLKVAGRRIGEVVLPPSDLPRAWHQLYPLDFAHELAARVDAEHDRQALRNWWRTYHDRPGISAAPLPLHPDPERLIRVLSRRRADRWFYLPESRAIRCRVPAVEPPALLRGATADYNLVRAACIWLGSRGQPDVRRRLVRQIANPSPTVSYNAIFALRYDPDPDVQRVLERYDGSNNPNGSSEPADKIRGDVPRIVRLTGSADGW